ncbi:MAG TPA: DUF3788 family protein [Polyangia bacterium]|nr:DUF3788 family protein [Polyangia bacterium]
MAGKPTKPPAKPAAKPAVKAKAAPPKASTAKAAPVKAAPPKPAPPAKAPAAAKPAPAAEKAKPKAAASARAPFPKKNLPPTEAEFAARLPLAVGKRFESVRAFLKKQPGVREELYYYGPKTGWAYRYLRGAQSVCSIVIHDDRLMGIVALDAATQTAIVWEGLSPIAQRARKLAHGSPALIWVDVPFEGPGAKDFQAMLKSKLRTMPAPAA